MNFFGFNISRTTAKQSESSGRLIQADKDIIMKIVDGFKDKSRKDIDKWRTAIKLTEDPEKPRYNLYHDLIDDLMTDGHLKGELRLRKYSILNTPFSVADKSSDQPNEEATEFFEQKWFYDILSHYCNRDIAGHTLLEVKAFLQGKIEHQIIPRRNVVPQRKIIVPDLTKEDTIDYTDPYFENWLIEMEADDDNPLGIINDIIPNLIWKRNVAQSWAEFCEKFGMPLITATTNTTDPKKLDKIEFMLQQIGEASTGVFPIGTTVDVKEASRTDAYNTYLNFIKFNREEISVAIIGGTMITNDGSSRSQSEVHERNLDDKIAMAVKRGITFFVNDQIMPILRNQGYTFIKENDRFKFNDSHNLDLDKYWAIVQGVMQEHEVDEKWLADTFHIPIKGKKKSTALINPVALGVRFPQYPDSVCCDDHSIAIALGEKLKKTQDLLAREVFDDQGHLDIQAQLIVDEANELIEGLYKGYGKNLTAAAWNAPDHLMLQQMEMNIIEFAASKTEARLASMTDLMVNREKSQIRTFEQFKAEVDKVTNDYNTTWLQTEYNISIATAQNSAAYLRQLAEADTVTPYVQYQTVGDSKVRNEHQLLDGLVFRLSDPEAMRLYPPNGYGCRCEMVQYVGEADKVIKGKAALNLMGEKFLESDFSFNRADAKQVFSKAQFYTDNGEILNKINKLNYEDYRGLNTWAILKKGLKKLQLDKTITTTNKDELFKAKGKIGKQEIMTFEDHLKRNILLKKSVFDTHTSGKYVTAGEVRHQLFPHVKNALKNADEVWLSTIGKKHQFTYIKFYGDKVLVVKTELGLKANEIKTWYVLKTEEADVRKGLLLKKKKV